MEAKGELHGSSSRVFYLVFAFVLFAAPHLAIAGTLTVYPPPDITAEATGPLTAVDIGQATSSAPSAATVTADDTGPFSVGVHVITWTATTSFGLTGTATQTVTITDTTAPAIIAPDDLVLTYAEGQSSNITLGSATATDLVDGTLPATPSTTGPLAVGWTDVTWSATDSHGNTATAVQHVLVLQNTTSGSGGPTNPSVATSPIGTFVGAFSVSPTGASTYELPIAVAPGINGMQPKLALAYNSQSGDGLLGMGWSLKGMSAISRCGSTIATDGVKGGVYLDDRDKFCLDGQRLISVGGSEYRTQIQSWQRIVANGGSTSDPQSFVVYTKDGKTLTYGASDDSRVEAGTTGIARLWLLTQVTDESGNYYSITYSQDSTNGEYHPIRIDYGSTNASMPVASVYFTYQARTIPISGYFAGTAVSTTQLLTNIFSVNGGNRYREYRLVYGYSSTTNRPLLQSVQECGSDGVCHTPTTFAWAQPDTGFTSETWAAGGPVDSSSGLSYWGTGGGGNDCVGDFNGDGKMDIVSSIYDDSGTTGVWHTLVRYSTGSGFQVVTSNGRVCAGSNLRWIGDFNGDGITDIATGMPNFNGGSTIHVTLFSKSGYSSYAYTSQNPISLQTSHTLSGDFDGDGRTDIITDWSGRSVYM